jgi:hypothetical protein
MQTLRTLHPQEMMLKAQGWGTLPFPPQIDETDMQIMMGRIMNLVTIQANEFTAISRARVIDSDTDEILAEQKLEENLGR